jgi:hypothetical protein
MDETPAAAGPAAASRADDQAATPTSFEQAMAELEDIVRRMQEQVRVLEGDLLRPFETDGSGGPQATP